MKKVYKIATIILGFVFACIHCVYADEKVANELYNLQPCKDNKVGLKLLCNQDWKLREEEETLFMVIFNDPAVTLTISKSQTFYSSLDQLTDPILQVLGQYGPGFTTQRFSVGGQEALEVDGYAEQYPEIRLRDYYLIHNSQLYSLLFSVNPRERWEDYQSLFEKIIRSVEFL